MSDFWLGVLVTLGVEVLLSVVLVVWKIYKAAKEECGVLGLKRLVEQQGGKG